MILYGVWLGLKRATSVKRSNVSVWMEQDFCQSKQALSPSQPARCCCVAVQLRRAGFNCLTDRSPSILPRAVYRIAWYCYLMHPFPPSITLKPSYTSSVNFMITGAVAFSTRVLLVEQSCAGYWVNCGRNVLLAEQRCAEE